MNSEPVENTLVFNRLIAHIRAEVTASVLESPDADRLVLEQLVQELDDLGKPGTFSAAGHQAVSRWLDDAVALCPPDRSAFAHTFADCASRLHWNTPYPDLSPTPQLAHYWANYCYAVVVSPDDGARPVGPFWSETMALFLTVQGADVVYDRHHHPAVEIYGVVSGTGSWLRGSEGFRPRRPGEVFVHQANMVHATTTTGEPTISWVAWLSDLDTPPAMV